MEDEDPFGIIEGSKESLDQLIQNGSGLSYSWNSPFASRSSSIFVLGSENSIEQKSASSGEPSPTKRKKNNKIKFKKSFERAVLEKEAENSVSNEIFDRLNPVASGRTTTDTTFRLNICDNCGGLVNQKNGIFQCSECGKMIEIESFPA